jgi:hypothetical protein
MLVENSTGSGFDGGQYRKLFKNNGELQLIDRVFGAQVEMLFINTSFSMIAVLVNSVLTAFVFKSDNDGVVKSRLPLQGHFLVHDMTRILGISFEVTAPVTSAQAGDQKF